VEAVRGIDLTVPRGTVYALLGPNGAGKTTLFRVLTTLVAPWEGTAAVAGLDLRREPGAIRQRIGLIGQRGGCDGTATGRENLSLACRLYGLTRKESRVRVAELEDAFDLGGFSARLARTCSGGQRRRLEIAMGLVHRPEILFLDEPTTGLDPLSRAGLWDEVKAIRGSGATVVLTTHYLDEADVLADRLCIMDNGRVIAEGPPEALKRDHGATTLDGVFLGLTGRSLRHAEASA
jgi:ABC-2 type transport system ATP-binding protein